MNRLALFLLLLAPVSSQAADLPCSDGVPVRQTFRFRHTTSGSGAVAYLLYVGLEPGSYDPAPVALVLFDSETGGVLRGYAGEFDPARDWYVALAGFGGAGEGPKSNELHIPATARSCPGPAAQELRDLLQVIDGSGALIEGAGQRLRRILEALP